MKSLDGVSEKVGINLDGPHTFRDFTIQKGNGNDMACFEDGRFDAVLCNAVFEHDMFFWKTLAEIKRVTKPGGLILIGTPGYKKYRVEAYKSLLRKIPLVRELRRVPYLDLFFASTITFQVHEGPGDYYRFSTDTFRDVFFEGMEDVETVTIMLPPRIVGVGIKPKA